MKTLIESKPDIYDRIRAVIWDEGWRPTEAPDSFKAPTGFVMHFSEFDHFVNKKDTQGNRNSLTNFIIEKTGPTSVSHDL